MIHYRLLNSQDALSLLNLQKTLDIESAYMLYLPHERTADLNQVQLVIEQIIASGLLVGAWNEKQELIGYLAAERGTKEKIKHSAYLVIGIKQEYTNLGIGTQLFKLLDQWTQQTMIHRLELTVITENIPAKALYDKAGFKVEGIREDAIFMNDRYYDEYYMAKIINRS